MSDLRRIKISAVSYTNTKPFLFGIERSGILDKIDLSLDVPAECAEKVIDGRADVGLIPVAALLKLPYYEIISDYCIGADGPVNSVFLFSTKPINEVKTVQLDTQSKTSNNLAKILIINYWNVKTEFNSVDNPDAFVLIGDRTFGKKDDYPYVYDLAEEWKKFTGLPFAFAVWAANKPIDEEIKAEFNLALKLGIDNREELLKSIEKRDDFDIDDYLLHKIDYSFDDRKKQALQLYLSYLKELSSEPVLVK